MFFLFIYLKSNLFLPYGFNEPRQPLKLFVKIFHAFVLVKSEENLLSQLKNNIYNLFGNKSQNNMERLYNAEEDTVLLMPNETVSDFFVRITFDGETVINKILFKETKKINN
jgi:hypothetical protein